MQELILCTYIIVVHSDAKAENYGQNYQIMCTNIPVYYTESKLNRLEGGNKRNLRSRDILSALTEARDDHLSQPAEYTQPATLSVTEDTAATNNPWSSTNTGQCHYHCSAAHV